MYAFVLIDHRNQFFMVARDHIGIIPLYQGRGKDGSHWVGSEMKCFIEDCASFAEFPPGHYFDSRSAKFTPFLSHKSSGWFTESMLGKDTSLYPLPKTGVHLDLKILREALVESVRTHLMSDVPYGVLLSGGLDSSLVASIMAKFCRRRVETDGVQEAHWPRLHSFCIGLKG